MAVASKSYAPSVLVSTERLPEKDWLEYRRRGIGGSDAAAILGISPFATARDLYYDKLKIVPFDDSESNWVAKKMGHLLEDLVAEIFHVKTGYRIYQIKKMFYHPAHTFMLADIDYFVELPGGRTAILEIKTTNYNAKDHWWSEDGQEIVPLNYEAQGRHYMAVMNIDEVFYCCLYGNNEDEVIIRHIVRDRDYEAALIDGCTRVQSFFRVILPVAGTGLAATVIFAFILSWNEFFYAVNFTSTTAAKTLPVLITEFSSKFGSNYILTCTAGVLTSLPPVLVALIFQRYIISGLSAGAVKG